MSIEDRKQKIIAEFSMFDDWMDKYNLLIEMGKSLPVIDPHHKTKSNLISGCQSRVWLQARYENNRVYFTADSDAVITKGIVSLLIRVFNGLPPKEIIEADTAFLDEIGLKEHLSPTRSNGLTSMIKQMKLYALAFKTKHDSDKKED